MNGFGDVADDDVVVIVVIGVRKRLSIEVGVLNARF